MFPKRSIDSIFTAFSHFRLLGDVRCPCALFCYCLFTRFLLSLPMLPSLYCVCDAATLTRFNALDKTISIFSWALGWYSFNSQRCLTILTTTEGKHAIALRISQHTRTAIEIRTNMRSQTIDTDREHSRFTMTMSLSPSAAFMKFVNLNTIVSIHTN